MEVQETNGTGRTPTRVCSLCCLTDDPAGGIWLEERRGFSSQLLDVWQVSAQGGCSYCSIIADAASVFVGSRQETNQNFIELSLGSISTVPTLSRDPVPFNVSWRGTDDESGVKSHARFELYTKQEQNQSAVSRVFPGRPHVSNTRDQIIDIAKSFLETCNQWHDRCFKGGGFFPTRILHIATDSTGNTIVKLVEKFSLVNADQIPYVALSHCWGGTLPQKLMHSNKDQLAMGLAKASLPLVFRDAVDLTQLLQIQYLWIDALCIIQDDAQEWETESAQMGDVYRHSYVTIAATLSKDGWISFLDYQRDQFVSGVLVPASLTSDPAGPAVYVRTVTSDLWEKEPLNTRGWAFQETILGSRVLQFTSTEVRFLCDRGTLCECGRETEEYNDPADWDVPEHNQFTFRNIWANTISHEKFQLNVSPNRRHTLWRLLVREYSKTTLTRQTDKLPALSGLASMFQRASGPNESYFSGIWRTKFIHGLCWKASGPVALSTSTYISPSWSWASIAGPIFPFVPLTLSDTTVEYTECTELHHVTSDVLGANPFGEVSAGAYAVLKGPSIFSTMSHCRRADDDSTDYYIIPWHDPSSNILVEMCDLHVDTLLETVQVETSPGHSLTTLHRATTADRSVGGNASVLVMCLSWEKINYASESAKMLLAQFLVLGYMGPNMFQRIGFISSLLQGPEISKFSIWMTNSKVEVAAVF